MAYKRDRSRLKYCFSFNNYPFNQCSFQFSKKPIKTENEMQFEKDREPIDYLILSDKPVTVAQK